MTLRFSGRAAVNDHGMIIIISTLLGVTLVSPWVGQECRPGFDERPEDDRFGVLR
jgi:hypothetical protein